MAISLPAHINKCEFELLVSEENATPMDPDYRESESYRATRLVRVIGQLDSSKSFEKTARTATGDAAPTQGKASFRFSDLEKAGVLPQKGDLIVTIYFGRGGRYCAKQGLRPWPCRYRIVKAAPVVPLHGKFLIWGIEFEQDRKVRESV